MITCQYQARRFTSDGIQFFCVHRECNRFQQTVLDSECIVCSLRHPSDHDARAFVEQSRVLEGVAPPGQEDVDLDTVVEPETPITGRSLLCQLGDTLPPPKEQDRRFHFESNGVLVFEKTDWEPPRALNGFVAKPEDPWRFIPLWLPCTLRQQRAERTPCGWLSIHMTCKCPQHSRGDCAVVWKECQQCPVREGE